MYVIDSGDCIVTTAEHVYNYSYAAQLILGSQHWDYQEYGTERTEPRERNRHNEDRGSFDCNPYHSSRQCFSNSIGRRTDKGFHHKLSANLLYDRQTSLHYTPQDNTSAGNPATVYIILVYNSLLDAAMYYCKLKMSSDLMRNKVTTSIIE